MTYVCRGSVKRSFTFAVNLDGSQWARFRVVLVCAFIIERVQRQVRKE